MNKIYRILDANLNRIAEGCRVLEDLCRFYFENRPLLIRLRRLRHHLRKSTACLDQKLIKGRSACSDPGKEVSQKQAQDKRQSVRQIVTANFKRMQEGLRTSEEYLKICGHYALGKKIEGLRFDCYDLEKDLQCQLAPAFPAGIYGITAGKFSRGRSNIEVVEQMIAGGIKIIQYREKSHEKSLAEIYEECLIIRQMTRDAGVLLIVNDFIDIALLIEADGVHIGQDDIPLPQARRLLPDKLIGVSTHSPEQARQAVREGADYIGVGPIFATATKENVCPAVGLEYLEYVVKNLDIPFTAIGGIKEHNLAQVLAKGANTVCLVTEITGAEDMGRKISSLTRIVEQPPRA